MTKLPENYSPAVDRYIANAKEFAQPILEKLREYVHEVFPPIEESMKWGFPHFNYKGIVCSMASFSRHCAFGFWKESLMKDEHGVFADKAMGSLGRISSLQDLPSREVLQRYILEAVDLNERGVALRKEKIKETSLPEIPFELSQVLAGNGQAQQNFDNFPPSHRKEYIQWIGEAKTEATRIKRANQAAEWISEGKGRNWKYEKN